MKIETYACDECGKRRDSDANHWWLLVAANDATGMWLNRWPASGEPTRGFHVCGQSCVIAAVNRFMNSGKLEK